MSKIEIYWDDLTKAKQDEIIEVFGDNCNYDISPMATIDAYLDEDVTMEM